MSELPPPPDAQGGSLRRHRRAPDDPGGGAPSDQVASGRTMSADSSYSASGVDGAVAAATAPSPSPEVVLPTTPAIATARLPGTPRPGYRTITGPLDIYGSDAGAVLSGPTDSGIDHIPWEPAASLPVDTVRLGPWALLAALTSLIASMFVGWALPVSIIAIIAAIVSLRRPVESRALCLWALVLGLTAFIYSAGWLLWAAMQLSGG